MTNYQIYLKIKFLKFENKVIDRLGEGLESFLVAEDKTIEGLCNLKKKLLVYSFIWKIRESVKI